MTFRTSSRRGYSFFTSGFEVHPAPFIYLNTVSGNDSNDGLSPSSPKLTYNSVKTLLTNSYDQTGTVFITAPLTNPVQFSFFADQFVSGDNIYLRSAQDGTKWYAQGFTRTWTSGWTAAGGGVYSRGGGANNSGGSYVWVTLLDGDGFYSLLTQNTDTPTTPGEGEFGDDGTNAYVHLPGDANPNSYRLYRPRFTPALLVDGDAQVYIRDMVLQFSTEHGISLDDDGQVELVDCDVEYHQGSCITTGPAIDGAVVTCTNVRARKAITNDGFNHSVGIMTLTDCEGSYCGDEGVSPHLSSVLNITGGYYHHNGQGGLSAVNNSVVTVRNARFSHNNLSDAAVTGGINFANSASGVVENCQTDNNNGPGFLCVTDGEVVVTNLNSFDNAEADVLCS